MYQTTRTLASESASTSAWRGDTVSGVGTEWIPGLELSRGFYHDVVRPLLGDVRHSAGLLGWDSDVLGYDTACSTDHGWGPRLLVFVDPGVDCERVAATLDARLPEMYSGWPVRFGWDRVPVQHWVTVTTLSTWLREQICTPTLGRRRECLRVRMCR